MIYASPNNKLIPEDPEPRNCKFIFIAPIYRELKNGNLKRLLEFFDKQNTQHIFELLFFVNNSPTMEKNSPIYLENQETLHWLKSRQHAFPIHCYDYSTSGFERNMGKIRQTCIDLYLKNHSKNPHDEIIIHLDADTHYSDNFLDELSYLYGRHSKLETVFFLRDYYLRDKKLNKSHQFFRLKKAIFDFRNVMNNYNEGLATYQISTRLSTHQRIGGFKPIVSSEDRELTFELLKKSTWIHTPKVFAITEDRARADGFNANKRLQKLNELPSILGLWKNLNPFQKERPALLHFTLFHEISFGYWNKLKRKEISYKKAVDLYQEHIEWLCAKKIPKYESKFSNLSEEEILQLNDTEIIDCEGVPSKICPVAAPFANFIFQSSFKPGTDLTNMIEKHLTSEEKIRWEKLAGDDSEIGLLKKSLIQYLTGKHYGQANSGFESFKLKIRGEELT